MRQHHEVHRGRIQRGPGRVPPVGRPDPDQRRVEEPEHPAPRHREQHALERLVRRAATVAGAVGYYADVTAGYYRTLIANYQGGYWSLVASPNKANTDNYLFGVDCIDATHCVAVGRYYVAATGRFRTLVLTLNGTTWAITTARTAPPPPEQLPRRRLVRRRDPLHGRRVLARRGQRASTRRLILERIGTTWSLRSSRNVAGLSNLLRDVSCPTPTECVAVGGTDTATSIAPNERSDADPTARPPVAWDDRDEPEPGRHRQPPVGRELPERRRAAWRSASRRTPSEVLDARRHATTPGSGPRPRAPSQGGTFNFQYGRLVPERRPLRVRAAITSTSARTATAP